MAPFPPWQAQSLPPLWCTLLLPFLLFPPLFYMEHWVTISLYRGSKVPNHVRRSPPFSGRWDCARDPTPPPSPFVLSYLFPFPHTPSNIHWFEYLTNKVLSALMFSFYFNDSYLPPPPVLFYSTKVFLPPPLPFCFSLNSINNEFFEFY